MSTLVVDLIKGKSGIGLVAKLKSLVLLKDVIQLTSFLDQHYNNIQWRQRFWHIKNDVYNIVKCKNLGCNNIARYPTTNGHGYICCSKKCLTDVRIMNSKIINSSQEVKDKIKRTNMEKYGVEHYFKTSEFKAKFKKTHMEKYGVEHYTKTSEFKDKKHNRDKQKFIDDLLPKGYGLINYGRVLTLRHHGCGGSFDINKSLFYHRKNRDKTEICVVCNPISYSKDSSLEKKKQTRIKRKLQIPDHLVSPFRLYKRTVRNITQKHKEILYASWDGYDFITKKYIGENTKLSPHSKNYPTIDHKISIHEGFVKSICPRKIGDIKNLCITTRGNNSSKGIQNGI